jgi:YesN/AraC family two-component response regulator
MYKVLVIDDEPQIRKGIRVIIERGHKGNVDVIEAENINLNSVSERFEKTNSYISPLFKKETGKNFLNYLTEIRIEKAKELMVDTNIKICDVAKSWLCQSEAF